MALPIAAGITVLLLALLAPATARAQDDENLITPNGVAGVDIGDTVEDLRSTLDSYQVSDEIRLTVDLRGHTVSQDGRVVFRAAQVVPDSPQIELFIISADSYRTAAGVGPGTTIADAAKEYGRATFMLDRSNSGREFVVFADQPEGQIAFRTFGIAGAYVGQYSGDDTTTTRYQEDAAIASVWIGCTSSKACIRSGASVIAEDTEDAEADEQAAADEAAAKQAAEDAAAAEQAAAEQAEAERVAAEEAAAEQAAEEAAAQAAAEEAAAEQAEQPAATESAAAETAPDQVLAKTGIAQTRQIAIVSVLVLVGASLVLLERRFGLGPEWLR